MKKVWYLFEEIVHQFNNDEFVEDKRIYHLYNSNYETHYSSSTGLIGVLDETLRYNKNIECPLFTYGILKSQVPLFEPYESDGDCYDYETIKKSLPKTEVGKTFIKEAVILNIGYYKYANRYKNYPDAIERYISLLQEYKECKKNKKDPINLTKKEIKFFEKNYDKFLTVTLLYVSKNKPTIEDFKEQYPELLI